MHKSSLLPILTFIAVLLAGVTAYLKRPQTNIGTPPLYAGLSAQLEALAQMEVISRTNKLQLARQGEHWVVVNRDNYPAQFEKVKAAAVAVAQMHIVESKTRKPELYSRLQVEDVGAEKSASTKIILRGAETPPLADVLVGKLRQSRLPQADNQQQRYVRKNGEAQSYLVSAALEELSADPLNWMNREIANVRGERIKRVEILAANAEPVITARSNVTDIELKLQDIPAGQIERSVSVTTSLATVLQELRFDDVRARANVAFPEGAITTTTLTGFDGLIATIRTATVDDRHYATFDFSFNPEGAVAVPDSSQEPPMLAPATQEGGERQVMPAPKTEPTGPSVEQEVALLNAALSNWAFVLPDFKFDMLTKKKDALLTKQEAKPATPAVPPQPVDPLTVERFDASGQPIPADPALPPASGLETPPAAPQDVAPQDASGGFAPTAP